MTKKIALVAGNDKTMIAAITGKLLLENATVICPAKSVGEIKSLKENLSHLNTAKLITFLTD